jgi:hypothetical protein
MGCNTASKRTKLEGCVGLVLGIKSRVEGAPIPDATKRIALDAINDYHLNLRPSIGAEISEEQLGWYDGGMDEARNYFWMN